MTHETHERVDRIAAALERYVAMHPCASDTIEGIQRWWLRGEYPAIDLRLLALALDRLVSRGAMVRRVLPGGGVVFSGSAPRAAARRHDLPDPHREDP